MKAAFLVSGMLLACSISGQVKASEPVAIGLHIGSRHAPAQQFNNSNPGVYVRDSSGLIYGTYFNSINRQSYYVGQTYNTRVAGIRTDFMVGVATGYNRLVLPAVIASWPFQVTDNSYVRIAVLPMYSDHRIGAVAHLTLEYRVR